MALRLVSKKIWSQQTYKLSARAFGAAADPPSTAPTVFDKLISLMIVDPSGARRKIPAMVGKKTSLLLHSSDTYESESDPIRYFLSISNEQEQRFMKLARPTKSSSDL